ncbi:MAG: glycosyltransferase [Candidatus Heimdallarchaeota archaeon]|nr:glycosyltransferase [Candidatus Heimdallarchaeota archaeon]MCK4954107.1 glycosyltransferase [Candidatus Heimdallarchaeota archaeon]
MERKSNWSTINHIVGYVLYCFICAYFIWSLVNISLAYKNELNVSGIAVNILALLFEVLGFFFALYFAIQLIDGVLRVGEVPYDLTKVSGQTKISVIIPIHNVQPNVLEETLAGFSEQTYSNYEVWVGDDSNNERLKKSCEEICNKYNATYYYEPNDRFKAHMVNIVIPKTDGELIAFFDVDHIPEPDILEKFVAIMEQYPEYAFIQAKFGFRNVTNFLHVWEAMSLTQQFCSENGRRPIGTVLYSGSTAAFRREYAYPLPECQMTEDFDHSVTLIMDGKRGYFLDELGSMSLVPETMPHQISQLFRWFTGQSGILYDHSGDIIKNTIKGKLRPRQALDIISSALLVVAATSFYFLGIFYTVLYFKKIPLIRAWFLGQLWLIIILSLTFIIYFSTISATTLYTMKSATFPLKLWHVPFFLAFGSLTAPFFLIPAFKGLFGRNKMIPGKTKWNKKIPIYRWASFFSVTGLFFLYLTVDSILQQLCGNFNLGFCYYTDPYINFFFILFGMIGLTLTFSLPFMYISSKVFKPKIFEEKHVYH